MDMPVVTRTYLIGSLMTTLLCALELLSPFSLYFSYKLIFNKMQVRSTSCVYACMCVCVCVCVCVYVYVCGSFCSCFFLSRNGFVWCVPLCWKANSLCYVMYVIIPAISLIHHIYHIHHIHHTSYIIHHTSYIIHHNHNIIHHTSCTIQCMHTSH